MAQCNVTTLAQDASCFTCLPSGYFLPIKLALLVAILATKGVTLSVDELLDRSKCFTCLAPGQQAILKLSLLCNILGGNIIYFGDIPVDSTNINTPVIIT